MSAHADMLSKSHQYQKKISKLIMPINSFFGIDCIVYIEVTSDNKLVYLTNNYAWIEHCTLKKYYLHNPQMVSPNNIGSGHVAWSTNWEPHYNDELYKNSLFIDAPMFGIEIGLTWIEKTYAGYKAYIFSSNSNNKELHNKLYSNISLIKHYIHYFNKEIKEIRQDYLLSTNIN
ncbi:MAG: hypothetical protein HRT87_06510, partial [Legionellales bacterium]|nr:hypothetical protein [Legionellales bacterium]